MFCGSEVGKLSKLPDAYVQLSSTHVRTTEPPMVSVCLPRILVKAALYCQLLIGPPGRLSAVPGTPAASEIENPGSTGRRPVWAGQSRSKPLDWRKSTGGKLPSNWMLVRKYWACTSS